MPSKFLITTLLAGAGLIGAGLTTGSQLPARAEEICQLKDPAGTIVNIRDQPDGEIVHTLRNGQRIYIHETAVDTQNRPWVQIGGFFQGGYRVWGWVVEEFVSCENR